MKTLKINKLFDLSEKIEIEGKTRQNAENKQTFVLTEKLKLMLSANLWLKTFTYLQFVSIMAEISR